MLDSPLQLSLHFACCTSLPPGSRTAFRSTIFRISGEFIHRSSRVTILTLVACHSHDCLLNTPIAQHVWQTLPRMTRQSTAHNTRAAKKPSKASILCLGTQERSMVNDQTVNLYPVSLLLSLTDRLHPDISRRVQLVPDSGAVTDTGMSTHSIYSPTKLRAMTTVRP
jgi:hypothetical protein